MNTHRIDDQDVDIIGFEGLDVVQTTETNIVGPTISSGDPLRHLWEHVAVRPDFQEKGTLLFGQQNVTVTLGFITRILYSQCNEMGLHLVKQQSWPITLLLANFEPVV